MLLLLGAYLAGKVDSAEDFLPDEWRRKTLVYSDAKAWAERIVALRSV